MSFRCWPDDSSIILYDLNIIYRHQKSWKSSTKVHKAPPRLAASNLLSATSWLQLESLELRRLRLDLIFTYKLVFGLIDVDVSDFFKLRCDDRNRGHRYKLFLPGYRSSVRQHFLSYRAVQTWNNLPAVSTDFSNLSSFKCGLNSSFLARHSVVYYF